MPGNAQLKFVMMECSKTQIRLTGAHILFTKWMFSEAVEHVYFNLIKIKS